jgi:hypothetical protein
MSNSEHRGRKGARPNRAADPRLEEFLDLVDHRAEEVKDIPPGRPLTTEELRSECRRIDPEARRRSLGESRLYFGTHEGKKLKDVPRDYLEWIISTPSKNRSFRKAKRKVCEYLGTPAARSETRKARQQNLEFVSDLDREYLAIIAPPKPPLRTVSGGTVQSANKVPLPKARPRNRDGEKKSVQKPKGRRTVHVACTRCEYEARMDKVEFGYASRRASRCRCPSCGGNVVRVRFVDRFQKD